MADPNVYNQTDRPVVIDGEGRVLGGGEWGSVDLDAEPVRSAVDLGLLVVAGTGAEPSGPTAQAEAAPAEPAAVVTPPLVSGSQPASDSSGGDR